MLEINKIYKIYVFAINVYKLNQLKEEVQVWIKQYN